MVLASEYIIQEKMKEIFLDELKQIELEILKEFKNICDNHGFNYSILAGTLLGAVRHQGFIPWDDDIDVMMPRPDYELFKTYCLTNETSFSIICNETNPHYGYMFTKLYNPKTLLLEENSDRYNVEMGISIDVFIYDGMGDTRKQAIRAFNKSALEREILVAGNWKHYFKSKTHPWYYEPFRFALYLISRPFDYTNLIERIQRNYKEYDFYKCAYVGNLCSHKRSESIIERSCFDEYIELIFEGEKFKAFKGYETYLIAMYGDYMKLPPVEKRITHHTFKAYWK